MKKVAKIVKIAGLLAIAISTSACVSSNKVSQNAVTQTRPIAAKVQVGQHQCLPHEKIAQLQISSAGAAKILDAPTLAQAKLPVANTLVSRNSPVDGGQLVASVKPSYNIVNVIVDVPNSLIVSEANRFVPKGDIVWREDPLGDRREQVRVILVDAIRNATASMNGSIDVILGAKVKMFHALSEKARYTTGGRHNIMFDYTLFDAKTGQPISKVKTIDTKFKAYGGRKAFAAERRGETQKVRISQHVGKAVRDQLLGTGAS